MLLRLKTVPADQYREFINAKKQAFPVGIFDWLTMDKSVLYEIMKFAFEYTKFENFEQSFNVNDVAISQNFLKNLTTLVQIRFDVIGGLFDRFFFPRTTY